MTPGEFLGDQDWIGARLTENAGFVPPPTQGVANATIDPEKCTNDKGKSLPMVIKMALVHYKFETIHPFPDANGHVGRMLMPLMLRESKEVFQPPLYLSSYLEKNYDTYIDRMFAVGTRGKWEEWIGKNSW